MSKIFILKSLHVKKEMISDSQSLKTDYCRNADFQLKIIKCW